MGLAYAAQARAVAEAEFNKVSLNRVSSSLMTGAEGIIQVTLKNDAGYPMSVELGFSGEGVEFPGGERIALDLAPGETEIPVTVGSEGGSHSVVVSLVAGSSVLDEQTHVVRFLGLMTVLPWVVAAVVLLLAGGAYVIVRRRRRVRTEDSGI